MGQIFVRFISIVLMEFLHQKSYVYAPKKKKKNSIAERKCHHMLKWDVCGLNYQAQFILLNQIQAVLGNPIQLGL